MADKIVIYTDRGSRGKAHSAAQHYPDTRNQSNFPFIELKHGQGYYTTIVHKFSVQK